MTTDEAIHKLDALPSQGKAFDAARDCIRRIWRQELSATLSGIEYHEPLATEIIRRVRRQPETITSAPASESPGDR